MRVPNLKVASGEKTDHGMAFQTTPGTMGHGFLIKPIFTASPLDSSVWDAKEENPYIL